MVRVRFGYWWWALPAVIAMAAAHYGATAVGGFFAFTDWKGLGDFTFVGLDNFHRVFADPKMLTALVNTLVLAAGFVVGTNGIGLLLALGLNRGVKSRYLLRTLLFMPVVLSPLAVSYLWRFIFDFHGPLNSLLESIGREDLRRIWLADPTFSLWVVMFVMVWQGAGIAVVVYLAGLTAVSLETEEAAVLDGAGTWSRFRHIVLPALRPAITISLTLTIIQGLRAFDQIFALTGGGPAGATETMATQVYKQAFTLGNFGFGAAMALVLTLVILAFTIIQQSALRRSED